MWRERAPGRPGLLAVQPPVAVLSRLADTRPRMLTVLGAPWVAMRLATSLNCIFGSGRGVFAHDWPSPLPDGAESADRVRPVPPGFTSGGQGTGCANRGLGAWTPGSSANVRPDWGRVKPMRKARDKVNQSRDLLVPKRASQVAHRSEGTVEGTGPHRLGPAPCRTSSRREALAAVTLPGTGRADPPVLDSREINSLR